MQNPRCDAIASLHLITNNYHAAVTVGVGKSIPYPRERGPMGDAPYTGPRLGMGRYSSSLMLYITAPYMKVYCPMPLL